MLVILEKVSGDTISEALNLTKNGVAISSGGREGGTAGSPSKRQGAHTKKQNLNVFVLVQMLLPLVPWLLPFKETTK